METVRRHVAKMESLAPECGEPSDRYRKLFRSLWRAIEQRVNLQPIWMEKQVREQYKKPIQEVIERHLKGAEIEEAEPKRAAN